MKRILLSLALLASISLGISAQGKEGGRRSGNGAKALKELNLTTEQQEQMKALSADFRTKSEALRSQQKDLREKYRSDVKAILTPEQQAKWQEMMEKRSKDGNRRGENFGNKGRGGRQMNQDAATTAKLEDLKSNFVKEKKAVEISRIAPETQKERIQALKEKYRNDRREIIKEVRLQKRENSNS